MLILGVSFLKSDKRTGLFPSSLPSLIIKTGNNPQTFSQTVPTGLNKLHHKSLRINYPSSFILTCSLFIVCIKDNPNLLSYSSKFRYTHPL